MIRFICLFLEIGSDEESTKTGWYCYQARSYYETRLVMYSIEDIGRTISQPKLVIRELNRLYHTRGRTRNGNPEGINFFDQDWDFLFILDACRYDYFEQVASDLPGKLERRESMASSSIEWVNTNIRGRTYHDTVYVSANPKFYNSSVDETVFYDQIYTWERTDTDIEDRTAIQPESVSKLTREAAEMYPNKRIAAHFMQPHCPFLGEEGQEIFQESSWKSIAERWPDVKDQLNRAYEENLNYVLSFIESLFEELDGKIVVTADHGQLLGERAYPIPIREFAHPAGLYLPELVEVPWRVREGTQRRQITSEPPAETEREGRKDERDVKKLLEQLGYRS